MKRPWNQIDEAVYSLVTQADGQANMNICTYVSPVSMQPKLYAIAVYRNTHTLSLLEKSEQAVLQFLAADQYRLVRVLGQKTGKTYDKLKYLQKKDWLEQWKAFPVLKNTAARLLLRKQQRMEAGDHVLFLFGVESWQASHPDILTLRTLTQHNIIRI